MLLPSGRSIAVTLGLAALGVGAYFIARETSVLGVEKIDVRGAPPAVAAQVRAALQPFEGKSLVALDGAAVERRLAALPVVAAAHYDRDFPHTLRVFIEPERQVAVLRQGANAWLVSARSRVMGTLQPDAYPHLPRIWVPGTVSVSVGATLSGDAAKAVTAVVPLAGTRFGGRVRFVRATPTELTLVMRSGLELRLGDESDLLLKLAVARRVVHVLGATPGYVDLSVPGRPVSGINTQVGG